MVGSRHRCDAVSSIHFWLAQRRAYPTGLQFNAIARIVRWHDLSQLFRLAEKCERIMTDLIMTYLTIAGILVLVVFPVLVPAAVSATHTLNHMRTHRRLSHQPVPTLRLRPA